MQKFAFKELRWGVKIAIAVSAILAPFILFHAIGVLEAFELQVLDFMMTFRDERTPAPEIILVTVDDQTVRELGSPLPRKYDPKVIRELSRYGAKVIAIDFLYMEPRDQDADAELIKLTPELGNLIYASHFGVFWEDWFEYESDGAAPPADSLHAKYAVRPRNEANVKFIVADSAKFPHPIFLESFDKTGLISLFEDPDGRFRRVSLFFEYRGQIYPALSLVTLCEYLQIPVDSVRIQHDFWGYHLAVNTPETAVKIPINARGQILLNFDGPFKILRSYSVLQLLEAVQDIEAKKAPRIPLYDFKDKIVIWGSTETGKADAFVTPFSGAFPGMAVQATAVSNLLNGNALRQLPWYVDIGIVLALVLAFYAGSTSAERIFKLQEGVHSWLVFGAILLSFNLVAYFFLFKSLNIAPAMLKINSAFLLLFLSTSFYEKSSSVKVLHRKVLRLEGEIKDKLAQIENFNARIHSQDEQYKTMMFFIGEFERLLNTPAMEVTHLIETPLVKMQIIKDQLQDELSRLRMEKQKLEGEMSKLEYEKSELEKVTSAHPPSPVTSTPQLQKQFEEAKRVMENYKAFVQKEKKNYHFDQVSGMVNAVGNGKTNGETNKPKMQEILAQIARYGPHDVTVLITGETGTGKELVAKAVHQHSGRRHADFVPRNCAAIPEALIESELFGHVKGAFTSASSDRLGAFEQAHGGSIFLDEIGELKLDLQARLLRVLQEKKVQRVGSNKLIDVDVRVIAATNSDLQKLMEEGRFRADLYFRLDVARIHLPPLRERKEDIPHLAHYFLADFNERNNRHKHFTEEALMAMICHDWPGNVRELQNIVERSCIETIDDAIWLGDLPPDIQQIYRAATKGMPLWETVEAATRTEMSNLLHFCQELLRHGNVQQAVQSGQLQIFGIPRENCYEYIKTFIDGNASSFPQDIKEKLAKQAIVLMQDQLMAWCKDEKLGRMEELVRDIEKLLGRTRRMVDNWKREVGFPPFYS